MNNNPGLLDLPPFAAVGQADSFFDLFAAVSIGSFTFHVAQPIHVQMVITHQPPAPGESYINRTMQPVDLFDVNGNASGIKIVALRYTPTPPKEIDSFPHSYAQVTLALPSGATENILLSGLTTFEVSIPPAGQAGDFDGDGLDQVFTEMTQLDLSGVSSMGPVRLRLDPTHRTLGQIEERVNNTPGVLDLPPFAAVGHADSFFDQFVELTVGGGTFHPAQPFRVQSVITHKPPAPGESYASTFTQPIDLLTVDGSASGIKLVSEVHTPIPPEEIDLFPYSYAQLTLATPNGSTETILLAGPTTLQASIPSSGQTGDFNGNGLDEVPTALTQLDLRGVSSMGPVRLRLDPNHATLGQIEERVNNTPGVLDLPPFTATGQADSFFDWFVQITIGNLLFHPAQPFRMQTTITHKPPAPGESYTRTVTQRIDLLDANGSPSGFKLLSAVHTPNSPKEIDLFPRAAAKVTVTYPNGQSEIVLMVGSTTMQVTIPPSGQAGDRDGDGLDEVPAEMTQLDLNGSSSQGAVRLGLSSSYPALGQIEEQVNNTPGLLDLPPFSATGRANSFFDLFPALQLAGQPYHAAQPVHLQAVITHKPPQRNESYVNPSTAPIALLDQNGNPSGLSLLWEFLTPNPPCITIPPLQITLLSPRSLMICWPQTCAPYTLESTTDLAARTSWNPVLDPVGVGPGGQNCVTLQIGRGQHFYRLSAP